MSPASQTNKDRTDDLTRSRQDSSQDAPDWSALKGDVSGIAGAAVEQGRQFVDIAREQATGYVDKQKDAAAQAVTDLATSLRDSCKAFEDRPNIQQVVDSAAGGLEQLADTIRDRSFAEIYSEVEQAARRRPGMVAAGALIAGFAVARFIKASADAVERAEQSRRTGTDHDNARTTRARSAARPSTRQPV